MQNFKIVKDNNKLIREKCADVVLPLSTEDRTLANDMLEFLKLTQDEDYRKKHPKIREGIGLAAPQVGVLKKIIVINLFIDEKEISYALINPRIISNSVKKCYLKSGEGCLSVDNEHKGYVFRDYKIKVKAFSVLDNKEIEITARGILAIVLQHEIDHLSGILYYDHINKMNPMYAPDDFVEI